MATVRFGKETPRIPLPEKADMRKTTGSIKTMVLEPGPQTDRVQLEQATPEREPSSTAVGLEPTGLPEESADLAPAVTQAAHSRKNLFALKPEHQALLSKVRGLLARMLDMDENAGWLDILGKVIQMLLSASRKAHGHSPV